jgi:hypothetical protein
MTTHSRLDRGYGQELKHPLVLAAWPQRDADFSADSLEGPSARHRIPLAQRNDRASVPRPARLATSRIAGDGRTGEGRNADGAQIPDSGPPFRVFPWLRSAMAARHARRATGKLTALWAGVSSGRPPRVIAGAADGSARWPTRSPRARQRSDGRSREQCGVRPIPADFGGCCRDSRKAASPRAAGRAASPARGRCPSAGTAFLPPPLTLAAGLRGVPALPGPRLREPYSGACHVAPFCCR